MKLLYKLLILITFSCSQQDVQTQEIPVATTTATVVESDTIVWADRIINLDFSVKLFYKTLDSLTAEQINKFRSNDSYPFYKIDTKYAKKYIKDYDNSAAYGVYAISKQYVNDKTFSIIFFHWGDCIWDFYLVTIDKQNFDLIDSERILYSANNCSLLTIEQQMKTRFSGNRFTTTNIIDKWVSNDNEVKDSTQVETHVKDSLITFGEILPNGMIKREIKNSTTNLP